MEAEGITAWNLGLDNRGTDKEPFGYVYLDDTRVGFARTNGVWASEGWESNETHLMVAEAFLDEKMPGWNDPRETPSA